MAKLFCALGCSLTENLFVFPSRNHDIKRRKVWLDFFDMEEPNTAAVFACEKHFSPLQRTTKGIRSDAVPDISIICNANVYPFRRKPKNWRNNVIVVTPRDPEFNIYKHETGVFPQNLFDNVETSQPAIQMPIIKTVSCSMSTQTDPIIKTETCSMSTQTDSHFCGLVQISEISDIKKEYCLNCFYCSEVFPIEKWSMFVYHVRNKHFQQEKDYKISTNILLDHDYTSICLTNVETNKTSTNNLPQNLQSPLDKPQQNASPLAERVLKISEMSAQQTTNTSFNLSVADQVIELLNETLLNPKFLQTDDDNILVIKNTASNNIETSTFLKNLMNYEGQSSSPTTKIVINNNIKKSNVSTTSSKFTRPVYTINDGIKNIPSRRNSISHLVFPPLLKNKNLKQFQKNMVQRTLKNINVFENIYKTVKKRHPEVVEPDVTSKVTDQPILKQTPLNRCLKRTESVPKKSTEIVFEYTPRNIVLSLLENIKSFPVLWEFHEQPFNKDYNKAIVELCQIINDKWSLNMTTLKMKRSINRILRFYKFLLPSESIDQFEDYFDKCALFLPSSAEAIPRARCPYCCICFNKDIDLRRHEHVQHKSLKWPHKCEKCFERFTEADSYKLHKRLPHYEEIFKCEICFRRFNRRHLYNKHVAASHQKLKERHIDPANLTIHQRKYWCDTCKKTFPDLERHMATRHSGIPRTRPKLVAKCPVCSKEVTTKQSLRLHMKRHNKNYDYVCEFCGKCFVLKSSLNEHMNRHTGDKITCNICNLKLRKCNLLRHLKLVHIVSEGTIESTFRAKSYRYKKFLRPGQPYGRRSTRGPRKYSCKICNISFDCLKPLKDHNKEMHPDVNRTACQLCSIEFIYLANLKRHYRDKHKLHRYQVFKLLVEKQDLDTVLAMNTEELDSLTAFGQMSNNQIEEKSDSCFKPEMMHSNEIQDEIMKAVENLDEQEIRVDDDQAMNKFFTDLLS